jgi:hypothetical protein
MLKAYVLSAVANDYEDFAMISSEVSQWVADGGGFLTRDQLVKAVGELIAEGLVGSYELSPTSRSARLTEYSPDRIEELWFYVTEKGKLGEKKRE